MSGLQINHTIIWKCHLSIHVHTKYDTTRIHVYKIWYNQDTYMYKLI